MLAQGGVEEDARSAEGSEAMIHTPVQAAATAAMRINVFNITLINSLKAEQGLGALEVTDFAAVDIGGTTLHWLHLLCAPIMVDAMIPAETTCTASSSPAPEAVVPA